VARVVAAALCDGDRVEVFDGPEPVLLGELDRRVAALAPGVLVTWNGSVFDLPFLADRAVHCGVTLGLSLTPDAHVSPRSPLPGHAGAYRATWHGHGHLDAYQLYRSDVGPALRVSCSLKSIAGLVGLGAVEVDRETIHLLERDRLHAYVASDARLARQLAARRC
jgi:DNA polymerase elongation subunit (family B)